MASITAPTAVSLHLNGTSGLAPPPSEMLREAKFLEKLLKIRDEVLAGGHPHIQLPPKTLEQFAPRPPQKNTPPVPKLNTYSAPSGNQPFQPLPPRPEKFTPATEPTSLPQPPPRPFSAKSGSSGIDPVLLTKSDHLIRAELKLKRQQIERALKDQFDKKGRANDTQADDPGIWFDVEGVLVKAHDLVKPVSGLQPVSNHSDGSESFDENSYYSSQANSWSSERDDANENVNGVDMDDALASQTSHPTAQAELTIAKPLLRSDITQTQPAHMVIDLEEEPYEPADDIELYEPEPTHIREEQEESDYSPPPADVVPTEQTRRHRRNRANDAQSGTNGSSRRQSPTANAPPIQNPRKRRREEKKRQQASKRAVRSPEPYIKPEPESPPPFTSYPESQPNKRRALQPLPNEVEVVPRDHRAQPVYYVEQDRSPRSQLQYEPVSPNVVRAPRRIERDEQDLRRVASLQYARRPYSPQGAEPYAPSDSRQIRAASHVFVDRPGEPMYREVSVRPSAAPQYVRERSRSPVHEYRQSPMIMPPPRRIVVDQYGNKYYANPVDESSAPPPRRVEAEPFFERAVTREPTMRAPVRGDLFEEAGAQRMPPPPPRRYIESSDVDLVETRQYRQRETSHRPVESEYARDVVERRPMIQYEEMAPPREYIPSRAYSVRPEVIRREVPGEYARVRHESVQPRYVSVAAPQYREVSVIRQDPYDDRRYTYSNAPQSRRYVDESDSNGVVELAPESFGGETRRVSYRY